MRRRITRAVFATAAAGAVITTLSLAATGAASAAPAAPAQPRTMGPAISTTKYAGYEASGRDFRYITALIRVPDMAENGLYPQAYVQLSNGSIASGDTYTRAGIETCTTAQKLEPSLTCTPGVNDWFGFVEWFHNSLLIPVGFHVVPLNVSQGDGVTFSIYFDQAGNELHYVITPPTPQSCSTGPQHQCYFDFPAFGPVFDHAAGLVDYTNSTGTPVPLPIFGTKFRLTQFMAGNLTTYSGNRGSWVGPWTTSQVYATSNGLPTPQGTLRLSPSYLWSDGLPGNGVVRPDDAFGVWRRSGGT